MPNPNRPSSPQGSGPNVFLLVLLGWLIPGGGFQLLGPRHRGRGLVFFVVIHLTFVIGMCLKGGVIWPVWEIRNPGFSVINNANFIMQMGSGWPALLSLAADHLGWSALAIDEPHASSELGSFYCLVAGALNYFVIWHSLDRRQKKAFEILAKE